MMDDADARASSRLCTGERLFGLLTFNFFALFLFHVGSV